MVDSLPIRAQNITSFTDFIDIRRQLFKEIMNVCFQDGSYSSLNTHEKLCREILRRNEEIHRIMLRKLRSMRFENVVLHEKNLLTQPITYDSRKEILTIPAIVKKHIEINGIKAKENTIIEVELDKALVLSALGFIEIQKVLTNE